MSILKSKKVLMQIAALVLVAIVSGVCKHYEIGSETQEMILGWIFKLTGLSIAAHAAADVTSMIKGLQETKEDE